MLTLAIQLMINPNSTKESPMLQSPPPAENPSNPETLSSFSQEDTEEEELLFSNPSLQETFWSLAHTLSTESP
jgi:hypothetical protein